MWTWGTTIWKEKKNKGKPVYSVTVASYDVRLSKERVEWGGVE